VDSVQPFVGRDPKLAEETLGIGMRANYGAHERHHAAHLADVEGNGSIVLEDFDTVFSSFGDRFSRQILKVRILIREVRKLV
jgi:hypothetical protein